MIQRRDLLVLFVLLGMLALVLHRSHRDDPFEVLERCQENQKHIGIAMEMYSTDWSGKYPTGTTILTPNYLKTFPKCPSLEGPEYRVEFGAEATYNTQNYHDYYFIYCPGKRHQDAGVSPNKPEYKAVPSILLR